MCKQILSQRGQFCWLRAVYPARLLYIVKLTPLCHLIVIESCWCACVYLQQHNLLTLDCMLELLNQILNYDQLVLPRLLER